MDSDHTAGFPLEGDTSIANVKHEYEKCEKQTLKSAVISQCVPPDWITANILSHYKHQDIKKHAIHTDADILNKKIYLE